MVEPNPEFPRPAWPDRDEKRGLEGVLRNKRVQVVGYAGQPSV